MLSTTVISILSLIEGILPLVTGAQNAQTVDLVEKIITAIENLLPQIETWSETMYTVATNIITSLQNGGNLTPDQIAKTTALMAQVDAAWSAVLGQIDPDNPANKGTPAGDPGIPTA